MCILLISTCGNPPPTVSSKSSSYRSKRSVASIPTLIVPCKNTFRHKCYRLRSSRCAWNSESSMSFFFPRSHTFGLVLCWSLLSSRSFWRRSYSSRISAGVLFRSTTWGTKIWLECKAHCGLMVAVRQALPKNRHFTAMSRSHIFWNASFWIHSYQYFPQCFKLWVSAVLKKANWERM